MIGNDVIDLNVAKQESNWKRKGFLEKLFTISEQKLIFSAENQTEMVWVLWSLKESVYKAYQRIANDRGFYPTKIEISSLRFLKSAFHSTISLNGHHFLGQTSVSKEFIHSIAAHASLQLQNIVLLPTSTLYFKNSNGLPFDLVTQKEISVSHHGKFHKIIAYQ